MRTLSTRTLAALAYERGEEFDPGATPTPALVEWLSQASAAAPIVSGPGPYELRRRRQRERRTANGDVPEWFSPGDLVDGGVAGASGALVHGELV
jgi:hypothetical protein